MSLPVPLQISSQISNECHAFCSNLILFLSNINHSNPASSIVICDFKGITTKWWSSDNKVFGGCVIHSLTTSAVYTQLRNQPTRVINNSSYCIDSIFASHLNVICNSGVEFCLSDKCHHNLIFGELNLYPQLTRGRCVTTKKLMLIA